MIADTITLKSDKQSKNENEKYNNNSAMSEKSISKPKIQKINGKYVLVAPLK